MTVTSPDSTAVGGRPVVPARGALRPLGQREVRITGGFSHSRQEVNAATLPHARSWMDRLGWTGGFAGSDSARADRRGREFTDSEVYKLLEAMSWEVGRGGVALEARIAELTAVVAAAQAPDGYLHTAFGRPGQRARYSDMLWGHELYCTGHLLQAAVVRARTGGGHADPLLAVARRAADHVCDTFGPDGTAGVCGHPEVELGLVELFRLTGERRYLDQAALFVDRRGHRTLPPHGQVTFPSGAGVVNHNVAVAGLRAAGRGAHRRADGGRLRQGGRRPHLHDAQPGAGRGRHGVVHASGTSAGAAVDGLPTNEPLWGTSGSPDASDWYEIDFRQQRTADEVRLHFRDDRAGNRYRAPSSYEVQYWNGSAWVSAAAQSKTPVTPRANYNKVRFTPVVTQRVRVRLTHAPGFKTGLTEVKVYHRGGGGEPEPPVNLALAATPSASYTSPWESVAAVNDGIDPPASDDTVNRRWGTWPNTGEQWAELTWDAPKSVRSAQVYFFDDNGGVRVPASWRLQHWNGSAYVDVAGASGYPVGPDRYHEVTFTGVSTTRLRVVLQSGAGSVGLLEVKAFG